MIASNGQDYSQQVVDAFIVPTERGAALFVGSDYRDLDPSRGPFQLAVYGPTKLSPGEFALLRSRFEGDLLDYANRAAAYGYAWRRQMVLAVLELAILGILIAFLFLNPVGPSFLLGWALPLGFFVAAEHRLSSVVAFSAEVADRLRRASAPPRRIVPGLRGPRLSVYLGEVLRPYDPRALRRRVLVAPLILALAGGMLAAVFAFLAAGAFRSGNEEVLVVRGNEAIAFPSSATVFRLPVGFDSPSVEGAGTVSVVDGVGLYWAWPRPLTDRVLLKLNDRPALAVAPLGSQAQDDFVEVKFRYDVKDVRTFLRAVPLATADARIGAFLEFNLAQYLAAELARLEESGGDENSDLMDLMRLEIVSWLGEFVRAVNLNGSAGQIGIQVRTDPIYRFSNP